MQYPNKNHTIQLSKRSNIVLQNVKSKNDNCGIACILNFMNINGNQIKPDSLRKKLNIEWNTLLDVNDMIKVADYFDIGLTILNESLDEICSHNVDKIKICNLMLENSHYYLVQRKFNSNIAISAKINY